MPIQMFVSIKTKLDDMCWVETRFHTSVASLALIVIGVTEVKLKYLCSWTNSAAKSSFKELYAITPLQLLPQFITKVTRCTLASRA